MSFEIFTPEVKKNYEEGFKRSSVSFILSLLGTKTTWQKGYFTAINANFPDSDVFLRKGLSENAPYTFLNNRNDLAIVTASPQDEFTMTVAQSSGPTSLTFQKIFTTAESTSPFYIHGIQRNKQIKTWSSTLKPIDKARSSDKTLLHNFARHNAATNGSTSGITKSEKAFNLLMS